MNDSAANKILLVEGDPDLRQSLASVLSCGSREVTSAGSAREFRDIQSVDRFTLAIVDLNLPDDSGFAIIRFLRQTSPTRIIVHTRRDTLTDRVEAYTQGADIYMVKPTPEAELLAAVESLLRRASSQAISGASGWRLDQTGNLIAPGGERVNLSSRQNAFIKCLMRSPGKAIARNELRKAIGIEETDESGRALDMFVRRLRGSIEAQVGQRGPIKTIYRLVSLSMRQASTREPKASARSTPPADGNPRALTPHHVVEHGGMSGRQAHAAVRNRPAE